MPRLSKIGAAALAAFGWTGLSSVTASYLVVAGGGGGGDAYGGGGGAGGYLTGTTSLNPTLSYTVTVGAGGAGSTSSSLTGNQGSNSVFNAITSTGGGGGGSANDVLNSSTSIGANGGSGGGGAANASGGTVTRAGGSGNTPSTSPSQGNNGGSGVTDSATYRAAGGGGGSGAVGSNGTSGVAGAGGAGTPLSISGASVTYAGGGGGGGFAVTQGAGGSGGGGAGGISTSTAAVAGTANLGGGGGGAGDVTTFNGASGGSGVVIISYVGAQQFGGGIVTSSGGNTIHTFTTSGTLSPLSSLSASYLIVAGGGSGGGQIGGGGGAGGLLSGSGVTIDTNSIYVVSVGSGGTGTAAGGTNGTNSTFSIVSTAAVGGGAGGSSNGAIVAGNGGSGGGGGGFGTAFGTGTAGQGNDGGVSIGAGAPYYPGGGGGGASSVGGNATATVAGVGGTGTASSISGTSVTYAAGASGGRYNTGSSNGVAGTANTGNGGSGSSTASAGAGEVGGNGGSGIVIISYAGATQLMAGGTVTISGGNVIHTFTSSGYLTPLTLVGNSLRFRSSATAYLNRTFTNEQGTYTLSLWVKRGTLGVQQEIVNSRTSGAGSTSYIEFNSSDQINIQLNGTSVLTTTAVYRDPASWYQIILSVTASATSYLYVNGTQIGSWTAGSNPFLFSNGAGYVCAIGRQGNLSAQYFDGYMAEVNYIDGQALTPNSFGTFNSYGVWQPITYGGSYGTNGFYLPFTNTTSTTTLGYDFSPNGNNWTANNISVTTGSTYDSMTDVPTLTSTTAANYCTWNPLDKSGTSYIPTISNGNLSFAAGSAGQFSPCRGTQFVSSGKWYFEVTITTNGTYSGQVGIVNNYNIYQSGGDNSISSSGGVGVAWDGRGFLYYTSGSGAYTPTFTTNDVISCAFDADTGKTWFRKNGGSWYDSSGGTTGDPATGANPVYTYTAGTSVAPFANGISPHTQNANFGQQPFAYTPPSGFLALNTYNI